MAQTLESRHIRKAYLSSLTEGVVELNRDWRASHLPAISLEGRSLDQLTLSALPASSYADKSGYYVDDQGQVVFVFSPKEYPEADYTGDSVFVAGSFNAWQKAVGDPDWELKPEVIGGKEVLALRKDVSVFSCDEGCEFKFVTARHHWFLPLRDAPNLVADGVGNSNYVYQPKRSGRHRLGFTLTEPIEFSNTNVLLYHTRKGAERLELSLGDFFLSLKSDKELGAVVSRKSVTFRIFAPRAKWVKVGYFKDLETPEKASWLLMKRDSDFVWEATVNENLAGQYYWFRIAGPNQANSLFNANFKVLDPYAKAAVSREGPGIVIDTAALGKVRRGFSAPQWQNLVVLEGHVRDFVQKAPGFSDLDARPLGFSDLAKYARQKDFYPKRLGVNAIELQPIQENDSQTYGEYHWGYMTANYFAPHSGYATNPAKGTQVQEFRDLVRTLHEQGFAVILDVVYNHVGEPAHLMYVDKLYYFHAAADGSLTNWSGCGNDLRCDAPMAKRLVIDSLKHLMEFYDVDGFRFDLADLIGKPVLEEIEVELKKVRPDVVLIAEPWSFRGHIGPELRDTGFASWNDGYREFLKEYVRCKAGMDSVKYFMQGSVGHYATWPAQTVNYVESHDDRTWIDDITDRAGFDGTFPTHEDIARTRMMIAMLMMSIGMPMLHSSIDFLGTKNGIRNTYQDGERNALEYKRALEYSGCSKYFSDWIAFRLSDRGGLLRHYNRAPEGFFEFLPAEGSAAFACVYNASGAWGSKKMLFAANPGLAAVEIPMGEWGGLAWNQVADHERFLEPQDLTWANRPDKTLFLPRLACSLWEL